MTDDGVSLALPSKCARHARRLEFASFPLANWCGLYQGKTAKSGQDRKIRTNRPVDTAAYAPPLFNPLVLTCIILSLYSLASAQTV